MVVVPPADSIPLLTDSATDKVSRTPSRCCVGLTLSDMAVHGVNDDSDFRRRGHVDGKVVLVIKEGDARICRVISPLYLDLSSK